MVVYLIVIILFLLYCRSPGSIPAPGYFFTHKPSNTRVLKITKMIINTIAIILVIFDAVRLVFLFL